MICRKRRQTGNPERKAALRFSFLAKSPPLIGVDISSSSVKMVEIEDAGNGLYRVERYAIEPLPKDAVSEGNIAQLEAVADTVRRAWQRMGTRTRNTALALPAAAAITKKIIIPAGLRDDELELQVETEANQSIPFPLDEINLDFQVLGPAPGGPEEDELLIVASRKEKVEDRVAVMEAVGLKAVVMDVESFALQRAYELIAPQLPSGGRGRTIAVVDVGAAMMQVYAMHDNQPVFAREQTFGGNQLTQDIHRRYSLPTEEAEIAKRQGGLPENYETDLLQPFMDKLAAEVARSLQFFFSSTPFSRIDHILLAGGCAMIPGLDDVVAGRTQANTTIANPFASMALAQRVRPQQLTLDAPALLIACGLAMRRFG